MKRLFWLFIALVSVDILNKNLYLLFEGEQRYLYFVGQSISFLCYILFIFLLLKIYVKADDRWSRSMLLVAENWIWFGVADLVDELTQNATSVNVWEYFGFIVVTAYLIKKIRKKKWAKS